jgi:hypothetical protein
MKQYKVLLAGVAMRICRLEVSSEAGEMWMHPSDAHPLLLLELMLWDGMGWQAQGPHAFLHDTQLCVSDPGKDGTFDCIAHKDAAVTL